MKAIRIHNYGGAEVLKYEDAPRPQPAEGEVLIRIHAAGVNPADWKVREGCGGLRRLLARCRNGVRRALRDDYFTTGSSMDDGKCPDT